MTNETNGWEVFTPTRTRSGGMTMRIYKTGQLSLMADIQQALGAESAVLLFHREKRQIGLRAATPGDRHAYKLRRPKNQSTWLLNAVAFLKHYGLEDLKGRSFPATSEDGMVVVDTRLSTD
jgi:hypothetical protein